MTKTAEEKRKTCSEQVLLRIFIDKFEKWHAEPVYSEIVQRAHDMRMAGATVLEGLEGFGQSGRIFRESRWALPADQEVIVEIVDEKGKVERFLTSIEMMLRDAIVTMERAAVTHYSAGRASHI